MQSRNRNYLAAIAVLAAACTPAPVANPPAPARASTDRGVTEPEIRRVLNALADDSMEGRMTGTRGANRAAAFIAREMKDIGLTPLGDSAYHQKVPFSLNASTGGNEKLNLLDSMSALASLPDSARRVGYNLIGMIPGSDPDLKDQVVVIAAHYDHLGISAPVNGDSINNGADDDASGVTTVLEIARSFAKGPAPKRTIVFITTTGEEQGILGTEWYVKHPAVPLSRMVAEMEIEMIGRPDSLVGGAGKAWLTGYDRSTMGDLLKGSGIPIVADPYPKYRFFERSDNIIFARMGIPAHTLSSYNLHSDYHTLSDELSRIDFAHVTGVINAAVKAARLLADGPAPHWKEGGRPAPR